MSKEQEKGPAAVQVVDESLGDKIAQGITEGLAALQPRKVSFGEYQRRHRKPVKLLRECFDNGLRISEDVLSVEEITLCNQITRSGRYIDRKVEVIVRNEGRPIGDTVLEIRYSNKSADQRFENARLWRDFADMLKKILTEQEAAEVAENEEKEFRAQMRASRK